MRRIIHGPMASKGAYEIHRVEGLYVIYQRVHDELIQESTHMEYRDALEQLEDL